MNDEPDRKEWRYEGFPCLIVRNDMGALCGYVGLSPGHPLYEKDYQNIHDIDVHGGLTYSDMCQGHICHVPQPGEPEHVWWLGFDCAHYGDYVPKMLDFGFPGQYRDMNYVTQEVEKLADQLKALI